jgi:hypothetical protein
MWICSQCHEEVPDSFNVCWSCGTSQEGEADLHFNDPEGAPAAPENEPLPALRGELDEEPEMLVTVANCSMPAEAYAIRMRLENEGIPVFLADELTVAMDWLLSNAIGGIKVQVPDHLAAEATRILADFPPAPRMETGIEEHDDLPAPRQETRIERHED